MKEEWKPITGFEGTYEISSLGSVRVIPAGRRFPAGYVMKPRLGAWGYLYVNLSKNGKRIKTLKIHRLVAQHFIPNPDNKVDVNHKDGDKQNNLIPNLEWATKSENTLHAFRTGLKKPMRGARNGAAKLTQGSIARVFDLRSKDWSHQKIADEIGVSRSHIGLILSKKTWKHLYSPTASPKPRDPGSPSVSSFLADVSIA